MGNFVAHPDSGYLALSEYFNTGGPADSFHVVISHLTADGALLQSKRLDFWPDHRRSTFGKLITATTGEVYYVGDWNTGAADSNFVMVARIDPLTCEPLWASAYGSSGIYGYGKNAQVLANGDLLIVGRRKSAPLSLSYPYHPFVMRLDPNGNLKWHRQKRLFMGEATAILESPDGDLFIAGTTKANLNPYGMSFLTRLDSAGLTQWTRTYSANNSYFGPRSLHWVDGGRIGAWGSAFVNSLLQSNALSSYVLLDTAGTFLSARNYTPLRGGGRIVREVPGGFLETGYSHVYGPDTANIYLLHTDSLANPIWFRAFDADYAVDSLQYSSPHGLLATSDDGFRISAYGLRDSNTVDGEVFFFNTDSVGYSGCLARSVVVSPVSRNLAQGVISTGDTAASLQTFTVPYTADTAAIIDGLRCNTDCVWPGDANDDGIANHYDLLSIGLAYGYSGPGRGAVSRVWTCQSSSDWGGNVWGANYKHIDCMGDGTINAGDTAAIFRNYSQTHSKADGIAGADQSSPTIMVLFPTDTAFIGDTIHAPIWLGTAQDPVDSIYGIAFNILYDNSLVDTNSAWITYDSSWFGDASNSLGIYYDMWDVGNIDAALTKIDHQNSDGYAEIATLHFILIDNIEGKKFTAEALHVNFDGLLANDRHQDYVSLNARGDSLVILDPETFVAPTALLSDQLAIYPNPSADQVRISSELHPIQELSLLSLDGRTLYQTEPRARATTLDVRTLAQGIYLLKIQTETGVVYHKFVRE